MEPSILLSTKKILGIAEDYKAFDLDIITHLNAALSSLQQLGVGPPGGFAIEDETAEWEDLGLPLVQLSMAKSYIYLKVRQLFDPPTTSFLLEATNKQIEQFEFRLNLAREELLT